MSIKGQRSTDSRMLDQGRSEVKDQKAGRTVFEDEANGGHRLAADQHDGVVPGGPGKSFSLSVRVQDKAAALVEQLLVVQRDTGPSHQQFLEQSHPEDNIEKNKFSGTGRSQTFGP